jgi:hypothetical protein
MRQSRYLEQRNFVEEARKLQAMEGYLSSEVLERLEQQRLIVPRLRLRYPDDVERRWWIEAHPRERIRGAIAGDTPDYFAASELERLRQSSVWFEDPRTRRHPLDSPRPEFKQFIQYPDRRNFVPWTTFRVDLNADPSAPRYTTNTVVTYYTSWQLLQFAEVANMGVLVHINLEAHDGLPSSDEIAAAPRSISFYPLRAIRGFRAHRRALDSIVWFGEEEERGEIYATRHDHRRRLLSEEERRLILDYRLSAAAHAKRRYRATYPSLLAATRFLAERWCEWERRGRPLVAAAYKSFLYDAVRLCALWKGVGVETVKADIGHVGGYFKPILDVIWENWTETIRDDTRHTLASFGKPETVLQGGRSFTGEVIEAFLDLIETENLHSLYWRVKSMNEHAFSGSDYALPGMKIDVQALALVLEHVSFALGAPTRATQLYDKFKKLWRNSAPVVALLKSTDFSRIARSSGSHIDLGWWSSQQPVSEAHSIASDLAISHAIRGSAHSGLSEDNPFEVEKMYLILLRTAVATFAEALRRP